MDFWNVYKVEEAKAEFARSRLYVRSRDRIHTSLSTVENYSTPLDSDRGIDTKYSEDTRYVIAKGITHDLFVSIYDVNSARAVLFRFSSPLSEAAIGKTIAQVRKIKKPNIEMRFIGLQNNETDLLSSLNKLHKLLKCNLQEVDLFGSETRHIAFDLKLGMSFNLLLLNRIYGPTELVNTISIEEFNKRKSEFKFV